MSDYPLVALRELMMNAVLHRSYEATAPVRIYWFSDRVEIQNPGGLYGVASPENFPRQNSYPESGTRRGNEDAGIREPVWWGRGARTRVPPQEWQSSR